MKRNRSSSGSGAPWLSSATSVTPQADMGTSAFLFFGLKASMKKRWSHNCRPKPGTSTWVGVTLMVGRPQSNAVLLRMTVLSALSSKR
ncbi:MAG: hypothetical protein ACK53Y_11570, partial [bacterium]